MSASSTKSVGVLGNANHVILRLTIQKLLAAGIVPTFVLEDLGSAPMIRKTTWYQEQWDNTSSEGDSALPSVADMLVPHSHVAHYTVDNCNSPEACALMKQHTCELFLLANTRVVKECVLEIPTVTCFSK
jgi:hypothetical protein